MAHQQQAFCNRCNRPTLHTQEITQPNHGLHWVMMLFCCGCWIPIYVLLLVIPHKHPWLCSVCGEKMGHIPDEVQQQQFRAEQARRQSPEYRRQQRIAQEEESLEEEHNSRLEEAAKQRRQEKREALAANARQGVRHLFDTVVGALGQANHVLKLLAGEDVFMLRFFQVLTVLGGLGIASGVIYLVLRTFEFI